MFTIQIFGEEKESSIGEVIVISKAKACESDENKNSKERPIVYEEPMLDIISI